MITDKVQGGPKSGTVLKVRNSCITKQKGVPYIKMLSIGSKIGVIIITTFTYSLHKGNCAILYYIIYKLLKTVRFSTHPVVTNLEINFMDRLDDPE